MPKSKLISNIRVLFYKLLPILPLIWSQNSLCGPLNENISVVLKITGDLTGDFELSGPLNQNLKAESSVQGGCEADFMFRKVTAKGRIALEVWPTLNCGSEGQKKTYKLHRSFLDPAKEMQKISVKSFDEKVQNLTLEFRDLSLQKGK